MQYYESLKSHRFPEIVQLRKNIIWTQLSTFGFEDLLSNDILLNIPADFFLLAPLVLVSALNLEAELCTCSGTYVVCIHEGSFHVCLCPKNDG